jgi:RNA polymerase sigma factor (TIGR02999 family)
MDAAIPLTQLIQQASTGDEQAFRLIFNATYDELRKLARSRLSKDARGTLLDTTSLVHESFLRLMQTRELTLQDRTHFFRYTAQVMRSIVVDFARKRVAERRGGGVPDFTLDTHIDVVAGSGEDEIIRVHDALEELNEFDPQLQEIVELRYFVGLTEKEIAEALQITERTVRRRWEKARLLLAAELVI